MTPEEVAKVFDPNQELYDQKRAKMNQYGNKIGLSICKSICERLGGSISAKSEVGSGALFTFNIKV